MPSLGRRARGCWLRSSVIIALAASAAVGPSAVAFAAVRPAVSAPRFVVTMFSDRGDYIGAGIPQEFDQKNRAGAARGGRDRIRRAAAAGARARPMTGQAVPASEPHGAPGGHPTSELDDVVHQRHRLGILTITAEAASAEFGYLQQALSLTPGNLSRHLTVLEEARLIQVIKGHQGRRPRTWVTITSAGRTALSAEIAALSKLLRRHAPTTAERTDHPIPHDR